jgi:hypothetical protein
MQTPKISWMGPTPHTHPRPLLRRGQGVAEIVRNSSSPPPPAYLAAKHHHPCKSSLYSSLNVSQQLWTCSFEPLFIPPFIPLFMLVLFEFVSASRDGPHTSILSIHHLSVHLSVHPSPHPPLCSSLYSSSIESLCLEFIECELDGTQALSIHHVFIPPLIVSSSLHCL